MAEQHRTTAEALSYKLTGARLTSSKCEQLCRPEAATRGKTKLDTSVEITSLPENTKALQTTVTVRVTGITGEEAKECEAFFAECSYRHQAFFENEAPADDKLDMETTYSLVRPIYHLALGRCQDMIWAMGFHGVQVPMRDIRLTPESEQKPLQSPRKRTSARKKAAMKD